MRFQPDFGGGYWFCGGGGVARGSYGFYCVFVSFGWLSGFGFVGSFRGFCWYGCLYVCIGGGRNTCFA